MVAPAREPCVCEALGGQNYVWDVSRPPLSPEEEAREVAEAWSSDVVKLGCVTRGGSPLVFS